jgi:hypothetical protein
MQERCRRDAADLSEPLLQIEICSRVSAAQRDLLHISRDAADLSRSAASLENLCTVPH